MGCKDCTWRCVLVVMSGVGQLLSSMVMLVTASILINHATSKKQYWHCVFTSLWALIPSLIATCSPKCALKPWMHFLMLTSAGTIIFVWNSAFIIGVRDFVMNRNNAVYGYKISMECQKDPLQSLYSREDGHWVCAERWLAVLSLVMVLSGVLLMIFSLMASISSCLNLCRCCRSNTPTAQSVTPFQNALPPPNMLNGHELDHGFSYPEPPPSYDQVIQQSKSTVPTLPPI